MSLLLLQIGTIAEADMLPKTPPITRDLQSTVPMMRRSLSGLRLSEQVGDWEMLRSRSHSSLGEPHLSLCISHSLEKTAGNGRRGDEE